MLKNLVHSFAQKSWTKTKKRGPKLKKLDHFLHHVSAICLNYFMFIHICTRQFYLLVHVFFAWVQGTAVAHKIWLLQSITNQYFYLYVSSTFL